MRVAELASRRVAIWGLGREGRAAIGFLHKHHPNLPLVVLDDAADARPPDRFEGNVEWALGADRIASTLEKTDVIVKSPGVSLYRSEIQSARQRRIQITSLLNLWFAERPDIVTICVTGTKGKSTTASLIAHILGRLSCRVALAGNIGVPITEIDVGKADYAVIEVSSYQAADFEGVCDAAVLTSLYPEHIDWHVTVENYIRDKINLVGHSRRRIINHDTAEVVNRLICGSSVRTHVFNHESGIHSRGADIFDGTKPLGAARNPYLARPHNRSNLCAALAALKSLDIDPAAALEAAFGFRGLPHRQQELGEVEGVLFVDDSISTIPESTLAALAVYAGRDIAVIVGGYDRGVGYARLVEIVLRGAAKALICLGDSGQRIYTLARAAAVQRDNVACVILRAKSMTDAVTLARQLTPPGGVVLLSPAAPSYGHYRDYIERGRDFAAKAGLSAPALGSSHSRVE
jgi:UDP-N-acetylmuramoyl-L-alanine---L-glutamate ligase